MNKEDPNDCLCPYHRGISAAECNIPFDCDICGWHPKEAKRRSDLLHWREEAHLLYKGPLMVRRKKA